MRVHWITHADLIQSGTLFSGITLCVCMCGCGAHRGGAKGGFGVSLCVWGGLVHIGVEQTVVSHHPQLHTHRGGV